MARHEIDLLREYRTRLIADVESRPRNAIQDSLVQATRRCKAGYVKGKRSFQIVARLDPESLREYLPSFQRFERVLKEKL